MLLEAVIALAIAVLGTVTLWHGLLTGLHAERSAAQYNAAVADAQSHLAAMTPRPDLAVGTRAGEDPGGLHWRIVVTPLAVADPQRAWPQLRVGADYARTALYAVSVTVSWSADGAAHAVNLQTTRLGPGGRAL